MRSADVTVAEFRQSVHPGVRLYQGAVATFFRVTVDGNKAVKVANSVISPLHNGPVLGMISRNLQRARAWMYDCVLVDNVAEAAQNIAVSSDNVRNSVFSNSGLPRVWVKLPGISTKIAEAQEMTADEFADGSIKLFPSEGDSKFLQIVAVHPPIPHTASCAWAGVARRRCLCPMLWHRRTSAAVVVLQHRDRTGASDHA